MFPNSLLDLKALNSPPLVAWSSSLPSPGHDPSAYSATIAHQKPIRLHSPHWIVRVRPAWEWQYFFDARTYTTVILFSTAGEVRLVFRWEAGLEGFEGHARTRVITSLLEMVISILAQINQHPIIYAFKIRTPFLHNITHLYAGIISSPMQTPRQRSNPTPYILLPLEFQNIRRYYKHSHSSLQQSHNKPYLSFQLITIITFSSHNQPTVFCLACFWYNAFF